MKPTPTAVVTFRAIISKASRSSSLDESRLRVREPAQRGGERGSGVGVTRKMWRSDGHVVRGSGSPKPHDPALSSDQSLSKPRCHLTSSSSDRCNEKTDSQNAANVGQKVKRRKRGSVQRPGSERHVQMQPKSPVRTNNRDDPTSNTGGSLCPI